MIQRTRVIVPLFLFSIACLSATLTHSSAQHGFRVQEYEEFHDVLHPLEHEALPHKDYKRIRAQANLLIKRGRAIVRVGLPQGTAEEKQEEFKIELKKFDEALTKFRTASRTGTNKQLTTSYSAVHDAFEMLAAMLR